MNIRDLFPLEGNVTQEIINTARLGDTKMCIGALTLKAALGEKEEQFVRWGNIFGIIKDENEEKYDVTTEEKVEMMQIKKPQKVTFIIL